MCRLSVLVVAVAILFVSNVQSVLAQGYGVICPLFTVYVSNSGQYLEYCNAYESDCGDIPDEILWWWDFEPEPCDCPDTSGCRVGGSFANMLPPIAEKVAANGLPIGFSRKAEVAKTLNAYVMKDGEPVYFRIFHCVFKDDRKADHTRSYSIGFEMKSPIKGIEGLTELKNWQPTDDSNVFKLPRGDRAIYLVRASDARKPKLTLEPTPAGPQILLPQASLSAASKTDNSGEQTVSVQSNRASF